VSSDQCRKVPVDLSCPCVETQACVFSMTAYDPYYHLPEMYLSFVCASILDART